MINVQRTKLGDWIPAYTFWAILATICAGYLTLVWALRYKRRDTIAARYQFPHGRDFASMTLEEAFEIQLPLAELEFPTVFSISIFFALFKVSTTPIHVSAFAQT